VLIDLHKRPGRCTIEFMNGVTLVSSNCLPTCKQVNGLRLALLVLNDNLTPSSSLELSGSVACNFGFCSSSLTMKCKQTAFTHTTALDQYHIQCALTRVRA
jgi:hypothetical protein